jgi:hypothetical protein
MLGLEYNVRHAKIWHSPVCVPPIGCMCRGFKCMYVPVPAFVYPGARALFPNSMDILYRANQWISGELVTIWEIPGHISVTEIRNV